MKEMLSSKKFQAMLIGLIISIIKPYIPGLDEASTLEVLAPILAYIAGQSIADAVPGGKESLKQQAKTGIIPTSPDTQVTVVNEAQN